MWFAENVVAEHTIALVAIEQTTVPAHIAAQAQTPPNTNAGNQTILHMHFFHT